MEDKQNQNETEIRKFGRAKMATIALLSVIAVAFVADYIIANHVYYQNPIKERIWNYYWGKYCDRSSPERNEKKCEYYQCKYAICFPGR